MPKTALRPSILLMLAVLLTAAPVLAGDAPAPPPDPASSSFLCLLNSAPVPAESPAPQPALLVFKCGVCSDVLCKGKNVGALCGAGPAFEGFRCNNATSCPQDGLYTCTCELA